MNVGAAMIAQTLLTGRASHAGVRRRKLER